MPPPPQATGGRLAPSTPMVLGFAQTLAGASQALSHPYLRRAGQADQPSPAWHPDGSGPQPVERDYRVGQRQDPAAHPRRLRLPLRPPHRLAMLSLSGLCPQYPAELDRTHRYAWGNQYGKLRWCTERRRLVVKFWLALANAAVVCGRLIRRAWTCTAGRAAPAAVRDRLLAQPRTPGSESSRSSVLTSSGPRMQNLTAGPPISGSPSRPYQALTSVLSPSLGRL
jgi:hypothetical protein